MEQNTNKLADYQLEIIHAVPGRMRLRLVEEKAQKAMTTDSTAITSKKENLEQIAQYLQNQEAIESVQVKETTNSIVVLFNSELSSISQLQEQLSSLNLSFISPESKLADASTHKSKLANQLVSLIPILLSWFIVKRFNLLGWKAIVAYVVITGLIGEVMEQVSSEVSPLLRGKSNSDNKSDSPKSLPLNQEKELDFKIVHYIPGRLRLSMPKVRQDKRYAHQLKSLLEQDERIRSVRINSITGSVTIHYLPEALKDVNEEELALMVSNWLELIDSAIALDTFNRLTTEEDNTLATDGQFPRDK